MDQKERDELDDNVVQAVKSNPGIKFSAIKALLSINDRLELDRSLQRCRVKKLIVYYKGGWRPLPE